MIRLRRSTFDNHAYTLNECFFLESLVGPAWGKSQQSRRSVQALARLRREDAQSRVSWCLALVGRFSTAANDDQMGAFILRAFATGSGTRHAILISTIARGAVGGRGSTRSRLRRLIGDSVKFSIAATPRSSRDFWPGPLFDPIATGSCRYWR